MEKILAIRTKKAYECLADPGFLTPVLQSVTDLKPTYFQQADFPDNMKNVLKDQIIVTAPLLEGEHAIGGLTIGAKKAQACCTDGLKIHGRACKAVFYPAGIIQSGIPEETSQAGRIEGTAGPR